MATVNKKKAPQGRRKNRNQSTRLNDEMIYFDGKVVETFPSTVFGVEVTRKNGLPPITIKAGLKTKLKLRKVMVIRGDEVKVEVNPQDMTYDDGTMKGTIVERVQQKRNINPAAVRK